MNTENYLDERLIRAFAEEPDPIYIGAFRWTGVQPIGIAHIASDLSPRALGHMKEGSEFYIIGYDSPNLSDPSYIEMEEFLINARKKGASFTYYIGKTDGNTDFPFQRLRKIAAETKSYPGRIRAYARSSRPGSPLAESYANQWKTFHISLFENPRQLWIELNHPEGKTDAYNCFYLPPENANQAPMFDVYKSRIQMVLDECAELKFEN